MGANKANKELVRFLLDEARACEETALEQYEDEGAPITNAKYVADIRSAAHKLAYGNTQLTQHENVAVEERLEYLEAYGGGKEITLAKRQAIALGFKI